MNVAALLRSGEQDAAVLAAAVDTAGPADVGAVLHLAGHPDLNVRRQVALTLPLLTSNDPPAQELVEAAMTLTRDSDPRVRDYACFALAEQWRTINTPRLRDTLADRLDDPDPDARSESLLGLAYRGDPRALPRVQEALAKPEGGPWLLELVAAGALGDPELHPLVMRHQTGWDDDEAARTANTARRLTDPNGPGDDILVGVAELYRRRAHDRPDGEALAAWQRMDEMLGIAPHLAPNFYDAVRERLVGDKGAERELRDHSALAQLAAEKAGPAGTD